MTRTVINPGSPQRLEEIQDRLALGLAQVDPHRRLRDRPVTYRVIAGQTLEITYKDVFRIDEAEVIGVKHLIGEHCYCSITPQTAETLTVRFVVPLTD